MKMQKVIQQHGKKNPVWELAGKPSKSPINQSSISDFIFLCLGLTLMDTTYFHNPFHKPSDCSSGHLLENSKAS